MLNYSNIISVSVAASQSKKGPGRLTKLQGRLKHKISNIDMPMFIENKTTIWDSLRAQK